MAVIEVNPLEKFSLEPLPSGDSCLLVIFGAAQLRLRSPPILNAPQL
jgi:hypothetical protein